MHDGNSLALNADRSSVRVMNKRKVVFCWAEISGYMAACFRELAKDEFADPYFIAFASGRAGSTSSFHDRVVAGLRCRLLEGDERDDRKLISRLVMEHDPEVVVLCGWFHAAYRNLTQDPAHRHRRFVMIMDTPWLGKQRQLVARLALRGYLRRMAAVWVTGERSWQYARRLGVDERKIRRGTYGIDYHHLRQSFQARKELPRWPRQFLFSGRFAPEKGIELLVAAYRRYRDRFDDPWPLVCCGSGKLASRLNGVEGLTNLGFVQPDQLPVQMAESGAFVLPSLYDPWPLALVEAAAAGLPILCSEACGSSIEVVRHLYNGYTFATDDEDGLVAALSWAHRQDEQLAVLGERSLPFAAAYSAEQWRGRFDEMLTELCGD